MPSYEFWYNEEYTYKAWFTAENKEEAERLMALVDEGELDLDALPEFGKKDKGYEINIDPFWEVED
jgi:hypothetical protein